MVSWSTASMPQIATFAGPLAVTFDQTRPLPLVLMGNEHNAVGTRLILSFEVAADPGLPADLHDAVVTAPTGDQGGQVLLQTAAQEYRFAARRVFVHRDLEALMRQIVPPQAVSIAYRLRWRFGIGLVRVPLLRDWLLARAARN